MDDHLFTTCSEDVQNLIAEIRSDPPFDEDVYSVVFNSEPFYLLDKVNSKLVDKYVSDLADEEEWPWEIINEEAHKVLFALELYMNCEHDYEFDPVDLTLKELKENQLANGRFTSGRIRHSPEMRLMLRYSPESPQTINAINHFIQNWENRFLKRDVDSLGVGMLALAEHDFYQYKNELQKMADSLIMEQTEEGQFGPSGNFTIWNQSYALMALARIRGPNNEAVQKGMEWLKKQRGESRHWDEDNEYFRDTPIATLSLIYCGEGPKQSIEYSNWTQEKMRQKAGRKKARIARTSPMTGNIKYEILEQAERLIRSTEDKLYVSTLRIDLLYDDIIKLFNSEEDIEIKILTRGKEADEGNRTRIKKHAKNELIKTDGIDVKCYYLLHSRFIISDNSEILVSSADLTQDQLKDEFNMGLYTSDTDAVSKGVSFFEDIWEEAKFHEAY